MEAGDKEDCLSDLAFGVAYQLQHVNAATVCGKRRRREIGGVPTWNVRLWPTNTTQSAQPNSYLGSLNH